MLIRVLSDVHGNLAALNAVLADPSGQNADATVCLGDTVGYGANPVECLSVIREICDEVVAGNHDQGAAGLIRISHFNPDGQKAIEWTRKQLDDYHINWIKSLPLQTFYYGLCLSHASISAPSSWIYIRTSDAAIDALLSAGDYLSIYGHTHIPMHWSRMGECSAKPAGTIPETALINCGSVGQPRDGDPRAAFLLINTEERTFRHVRVSYDIDTTVEAIKNAGLPEYLANRLYLGK